MNKIFDEHFCFFCNKVIVIHTSSVGIDYSCRSEQCIYNSIMTYCFLKKDNEIINYNFRSINNNINFIIYSSREEKLTRIYNLDYYPDGNHFEEIYSMEDFLDIENEKDPSKFCSNYIQKIINLKEFR
jgi:hypothetical protein